MFIEDDVTAEKITTEVTADQLWIDYFNNRSITNRNRLVLFYAPLVRLVGDLFESTD